MTLPNLQNFSTLEEQIYCNTYLSPPLSMAHKLYSENQIVQGIKDQDKTILAWIYKSMALEIINLFDEIGLGDHAVKKDYQVIFQIGMERVFKNIKSAKYKSGILKGIKDELKEQTMEHFLFEEKMKNWLFKNHQHDILALIKKIKISNVHPDTAQEIFNKIYEYLCIATQEDKYKTGKITSNMAYNIKLKTAEHYIHDEKTWS